MTATGSFRALAARRKMLTQRHYALPFSLGDEAFGDFKVRDLLGQGPIGVVYQVTDERGDLWALKVIHKRWREELDLDQFQGAFLGLEQMKTQRLCIPKSTIIHEQGIGLLMPFLDGLTFKKMMSLRKNTSRAFQINELIPILKSLTDGLAPLHDDGVAHGGIKPENLILSASEAQGQTVTLSDVRLSEAIGLEMFSRAQRASGQGHFVAPEIAKNNLSPASDIYSIGALFFEALTGQSIQVKRPLRDFLPIKGIDPLDNLLERAMHPDPARRFPHIDSFCSAFNEVHESLMAIEGSPFSSEGTQPGEEDLSSIPNLRDQATLAPAPIQDPLLGINTPPPLPTVNLQPTKILTSSTPPPLPMQSKKIESSISSSSMLDPLSSMGVEPKVGLSGLHNPPTKPVELDFASMSIPSQPTLTAPQYPPTSSWFLSSTLGFTLSALMVIGLAASGVYYFLRIDQGRSGGVINLGAQQESKPSSSLLASAHQPTTKNPEATQPLKPEPTVTPSLASKEGERLEKERLEKERLEKGRLDTARLEKERLEKDRLEKDRLEKDRLETARLEKERLEKERLEKERLESARAESERREKERLRVEALPIKKNDVDVRERAERERAERERAERARVKAVTPKKRPSTAKVKTKTQPVKKALSAKEKREKELAYKAEQARIKKEEESRRSSSRVIVEKAEIGGGDGTLSCPTGMIVKTTARFPRKSVKRNTIKGKKAVRMAREGKAYCIDAFEYPGRGRRPKVNVTFKGAQSLCLQANKRLCTDREWRRACLGRRSAQYPYGKGFNANKCNTEDREGEERTLKPAGSFKKCRSVGGAYDMSGNAAEWTSNQVVRGGYYASDDEDSACNSGGRRSASTARPFIGFRCCTDFK